MKKITGIVIEGKKLGRKLGFPTANVQLQEKLEGGVYVGLASIAGQKYPSAIFIWPDKMLLEAHILDFERNIYGREITIEIGDKIRDSIKFESEAELIAQIAKDIETIRKVFSNKLMKLKPKS